MTRKQFLHSIDKLVELPKGTLQGMEKLHELERWNSMAMIGFIALADTNNGVTVSPTQIMGCATVADLLKAAQVDN